MKSDLLGLIVLIAITATLSIGYATGYRFTWAAIRDLCVLLRRGVLFLVALHGAIQAAHRSWLAGADFVHQMVGL